jgi:hypothetical protein
MAVGHVPLTQEEIGAATVGELVPHNAKIHLADADPCGPRSTEREAARSEGRFAPRLSDATNIGFTSDPAAGRAG